MAFEPPWILAPTFLEQLTDSGLDPDQAVLTIREIIRSTKRMPRWALAPGPAEPSFVRYALPEVARLDRPLNCQTLDISTSTISAFGEMYGVEAWPHEFRARVEFWAADAKRLFPPRTTIESSGRVPGDPALVLEAFRLMQEGWTKNAAATAVAPRAGGNSLPASIKRITRALDKKIAEMSNEMSK
jgi:hypothetical protein